MISLFEQFDEPTRLLHQSLQLSDINPFTIVINDNGFLPNDVTSPYQFFSVNNNGAKKSPKYYNEVKIPRFWEIDGNNEKALIKDMGKVKGEINYKLHDKHRIVSHVKWLDDNGNTRVIDHYSKNGVIFSQTVYDSFGKAILIQYIDDFGNEIIYENLVTNDIVLTWQDKDYYFKSKTEFIIFYLKLLNRDLSEMIINSLGLPLSVVYNINTPGVNYVFWQEIASNGIPKNMETILNMESNNQFKVLVTHHNEYEKIKKLAEPQVRDKIYLSGYVYKYNKNNQYSKNALTITNSDQLRHIDKIIEACPEAVFHIASITEMSSTLMMLNQYENVKLYPNINKRQLINLYEMCDVYLDVNQGFEVLNSVKFAFENSMPIIGYEQVAHNRQYTANHNLYLDENYTDLINNLKYIMENNMNLDEILSIQKAHANAIDAETFKSIVKS
ncbi:accessory Sec system glycosylation chaperone GtfB [Staphylococcus xylosus]|uniref:accessory Sec system glycosylation chaperone GtfB n=1 Tax=Staphylococcus xylosus TaxID=1288 RepID=UPI0011CC3CB2|nr:accessory Sec system glycosylation chaperone GtfB [Staphylococcus xylosus]WRY40335.1 accessory Sec system glycosylation chaperone GtfB [Staphylococcus xylosus]